MVQEEHLEKEDGIAVHILEVRWAKIREPPSILPQRPRLSSKTVWSPESRNMSISRTEAASPGHLLAIAGLVLKASS